MAFTYGFYNYSENDAEQKLYDAIQMSQLFDGIITDGVYGHVGSCFRVTASSLDNAVKVGDGRAWFNHTWNYNDASITLEGAHIAPVINDRIDAVILDVDSNKNARRNQIIWKTGIEAEEPSRPTMVHEKNHDQYALAYIHREPGRNTIREVDIENAVGTPETPYVTGVLETLDTEQILSAFQNAFDRLYAELEDLLSTAQTDSSDIIEDLERTKNRCNAIYSDIQTTKSNCDRVYAYIRSVDSNARNVYAAIQVVKVNADSAYTAIQNTKDSCDSLYEDIQTIKTNSNNVYSQIQTLKTTSDSLYSSIQTTKNKCDALYSAILTTKADSDDAYAYILSVKRLCEQAESTIATLNSKIAQADSDLAEISTKMAQADTDLAALESKISSLEGDIASELSIFKSEVEADVNTWFANREAEYETRFSEIERQDAKALSDWINDKQGEYDSWFGSLTPTIKTGTISNGSVTFTNMPTGNEYYVDFFTEGPDIDYLNCSVSGTSCTLTYDPVYDGNKVYCRIFKLTN